MKSEKQSCSNCVKRGSNMCKDPLWCISMGFANHKKAGIGDVCPDHGDVLRVQKTYNVNGSNVVYTWKYCPICGYRVKITFDAVELDPSMAVRAGVVA